MIMRCENVTDRPVVPVCQRGPSRLEATCGVKERRWDNDLRRCESLAYENWRTKKNYSVCVYLLFIGFYTGA